MKVDRIFWAETRNGVSIECDLDVVIHSGQSNIIVLTVPGVDGTVDGYEQKYLRIAESLQAEQGCAVVRISNPFITSFHWESNVRHAVEYIEKNAVEICGSDSYELRIMAHSAGAAIVARIAHEFPQITHILLVNPAMELDGPAIISGLEKFAGQVTILIGNKDPSFSEVLKLNSIQNLKIVTAENADHNFSGNSFQTFLEATNKYLF